MVRLLVSSYSRLATGSYAMVGMLKASMTQMGSLTSAPSGCCCWMAVSTSALVMLVVMSASACQYNSTFGNGKLLLIG
jgi:hypothetical protein